MPVRHMNEKEVTRLSKFISLVLRHKPETIGLELDENGWADTAALIDKMNSNGMRITPQLLEQVVATNTKKRFSFNAGKTQIRANQGHSVDIDLQLTPAQPPSVLYHGTSETSVTAILETGLEKRSRQHVHLSSDIVTATTVGSRHGKPAILIVDAAGMYKDGFTFYLSDNDVWLTDEVPAKYLSVLK
ncbi:MAG: 2-phosphotransferase [Segetibacter sp.]|nr:2-phosphotransferase [Segetibacter sp.]